MSTQKSGALPGEIICTIIDFSVSVPSVCRFGRSCVYLIAVWWSWFVIHNPQTCTVLLF